MAEELRPFFCLDLSYAHTLLTKGFKIPDDAQITLVRLASMLFAMQCFTSCWRLHAECGQGLRDPRRRPGHGAGRVLLLDGSQLTCTRLLLLLLLFSLLPVGA